MADLYTVTFQSGTILRWTAADTPIVLGGTTFSPLSLDNGTDVPLIQRGELRLARGLEVPTFDVTLLTGQSVQISGVALPLFAHNGGFDWAWIRLERVVMPSWGDTSPGSIVLFEGGVAGVDPGTTQVVLHLKGALEKLTRNMPRVVFSPGCQNNFGDAACGVNIAGLAQAGTATSAATTTALPGAPAAADDLWQGHAVHIVKTVPSAGQIIIFRHLARAFTLAKPEEYQDLRGFYQKVAASDQQQLVLSASAPGKGQS